MSFQIGQKVACVRGSFPLWVAKLYTDLPSEGSVYTVREVFVGRGKWGGDEGEIGLLLHELHNPPDPRHLEHQELGFNANRFAPLQTETVEHVETEPFEIPVLVPA